MACSGDKFIVEVNIIKPAKSEEDAGLIILVKKTTH